jgi:hypothetical protein
MDGVVVRELTLPMEKGRKIIIIRSFIIKIVFLVPGILKFSRDEAELK